MSQERLNSLHREARLLAVLAYNLEYKPPAHIRLRIERLARLRRKNENETPIQTSTTNSSVSKAAE